MISNPGIKTVENCKNLDSQKNEVPVNDYLSQKVKEPIYFNIIGKWYKGKMPAFYNPSDIEITELLESNYEQIKKEVLAFYKKDYNSFEPMYAPYDYVDNKFRVYSFYNFMIQYKNDSVNFPFLNDLLKKIPNLVTAQISVLGPHTRVKSHFGGSNTLIRNHLGLVIPGKYPELGIRVRQEARCWEEGKVLAFCESHRHNAWNNTDKTRLILLIDTVHPDYIDKKYYISSGLASMLLMKTISTKFPVTQKMPEWIVNTIHKLFTMPFITVLILQNKFNINLAKQLIQLKQLLFKK